MTGTTVAERPLTTIGASESIPAMAPPIIDVYKPASGLNPIAIESAIPYGTAINAATVPPNKSPRSREILLAVSLIIANYALTKSEENAKQTKLNETNEKFQTVWFVSSIFVCFVFSLHHIIRTLICTMRAKLACEVIRPKFGLPY
jgi:hypothetical protein